METFSALLAIWAGNSPVPGEFPTQRPVTRSFDVFFDLHPNKRLNKQWWGWWFETPSCSLWRHRNVGVFPNNYAYGLCFVLSWFMQICPYPMGLIKGSKYQWTNTEQYRYWYYPPQQSKAWETHDDVMKWKHFPPYWPFVREIPGEFPAQRPVTRSFDLFFDLRLNKRSSKQWWGWWFETPSHPLWRHCKTHVHIPWHILHLLISGNCGCLAPCEWLMVVHVIRSRSRQCE